MWYVANDLDASRVNTLSGSTPIGIEMQKTIWAYNLNGAMANTIFASTKIINKSGKELDSMYVAQWADPDLGDANDDFVGCDTIRSLGYVYNGKATDTNFGFYGLVPPALGFCILHGPIVQGAATDTAIFDLNYRPGYKNMPMTSFNFFINGNDTYADPVNGSYTGTIQWYNLLRGLVGKTGAQYINPITNLPTPFVLSGDPVASTGWIDGTIAGPGDRRMALCSGPFTMIPGVSDTQEVVVANVAGRGADYLSSITTLKAEVDFINPQKTNGAVPQIVLSQPFIDFGTFQTGISKTDTLKVTNSSSYQLIIDSVYTKTRWFTVAAVHDTISEADTVRLRISFNPDTAKAYSDTLFIVSNASITLTKVTLSGSGTLTAVSQTKPDIPKSYGISQNYPNPFNPTTMIDYQLPLNSYVTLKVYDILGREVAILINGKQNVGYYSTTFNGTKLTSGVYFYMLQAGSFIETKKLVLLK